MVRTVAISKAKGDHSGIYVKQNDATTLAEITKITMTFFISSSRKSITNLVLGGLFVVLYYDTNNSDAFQLQPNSSTVTLTKRSNSFGNKMLKNVDQEVSS